MYHTIIMCYQFSYSCNKFVNNGLIKSTSRSHVSENLIKSVPSSAKSGTDGTCPYELVLKQGLSL